LRSVAIGQTQPTARSRSGQTRLDSYRLARGAHEILHRSEARAGPIGAPKTAFFTQATNFLAELIKRSPVRIVSIETSDHEAFTDAPGHPWETEYPLRKHPFRKLCWEDEISHIRLKRVTPIEVSRGWRGVSSKSVWDLYRRSPTKHCWRKTVNKNAKQALNRAQ